MFYKRNSGIAGVLLVLLEALLKLLAVRLIRKIWNYRKLTRYKKITKVILKQTINFQLLPVPIEL